MTLGGERVALRRRRAGRRADRRRRGRAARADQPSASCGRVASATSGVGRRVADGPPASPAPRRLRARASAAAARSGRSRRRCWLADRGACACHLTGRASTRAPRRGRRILVDVAVRLDRRAAATGTWSPTRLATCARRTSPSWTAFPATSVARTLLDCAPILGRRGTEKLIPRPSASARFDLVAVHDLLAHVPRPSRGAAILRACGRRCRRRPRGRPRRRPRTSCWWRSGRSGLDEPECNPPISARRRRLRLPRLPLARWRAGRRGRPARHARPTASYRSRPHARSRRWTPSGSRRCASTTSTRDPRACAAEAAERLARVAPGHEFRPVSGTELVTRAPQAAAATGAPSLYCSPASALATSDAGGSKRSP